MLSPYTLCRIITIPLLLIAGICLLTILIITVKQNHRDSYELSCNITDQVNNDTWSYSVWKHINHTEIFCTHGQCGTDDCNIFNNTVCTRVRGISQCE